MRSLARSFISPIFTAFMGAIALALTSGCAEEPASSDASAPKPSAAAATDGSHELVDLVKQFTAAIDRQDVILARYAKGDTKLKPGDGEPLWQASIEAEQALSQIAALADEHPDWKATIVQWWHSEIEPAHTRQFRRGQHRLMTDLLKQAAPDPQTLRSHLGRVLAAGVALDRLAKTVATDP